MKVWIVKLQTNEYSLDEYNDYDCNHYGYEYEYFVCRFKHELEKIMRDNFLNPTFNYHTSSFGEQTVRISAGGDVQGFGKRVDVEIPHTYSLDI